MKKVLFFIAILIPLLNLSAQQTDLPTYGYHYQAIIRDGSGNVAANTPVQLQFQFLDATNQMQYQETHTDTTDQFGRVAVVVGSGMDPEGLFDTLNWAARKHFLGVAVKLDGATNWAELGKEEVVLPPISKISADGGKFVGVFPISGFEEGAPVINKNTWQIVTRTEYRRMEKMFQQPVPSGMTRHYYFFIRKADNIDNCADSTDWRFYYPWDNKPGHQFKVWRDWGQLQDGSYVIIETLPIKAQYSQYTHAYWQLEAKIPSTCTGKQMRVMGVSVFAIDKPDSKVPILKLNQEMVEGEEPQYAFGGPGGNLFISTEGYLHSVASIDIDLQGFTGSHGRDAIHILASPDNTDGVITVNKPNLSFWNSVAQKHANIKCGTLTILGNDRAHLLNTTDGAPIPATTAVVFDEIQPGKIRPSNQAYDRKVAGVISDTSQTARHRTGIIHAQENTAQGSPVAIDGTVEVLAIGPVAVGDFLTTSDVSGHAMKAKNRRKGYGAILGKAMTPLAKGEKGKVEMWVERH